MVGIARRGVIGSGLTLGMAAATAGSSRGQEPPHPARAGDARSQASDRWATVWTASVQGPYPVGNPSAQPDQRFALPDARAGARDQTFRLMVTPALWTDEARLRFSNAFGTRPVTFDGVFVGQGQASAELVPGSNRPVRFGGRLAVTVPPGGSVWSDAVSLPFVLGAGSFEGRRLAASFHVAGESGPMTWHAKALSTSYLGAPGSGSHGGEEGEGAFPFTTASWFFLDALDMRVAAGTEVIVAFGDSITDGTASTLNGDDRWPDVLQRRLRTVYGPRFVVVNAGIGGNQVVGPTEYGPDRPFPGGPSALSRLDRDVVGLSGVTSVIWLEGINDFSRNGNRSADEVITGMREGVGRLRAALNGVRVVGATLTSCLGSSSPAHGFPEQDEKRRALNDFIRGSGVFDAVVDFDRVTIDEATGGLRPEFVPESTTGGPGDGLHPNRTGYLRMGMAFDLATFARSSVHR